MFLDSAQTILQVTNYTGVYTSSIVELNYSHFNWYYTDIYGVKRYGEEIPKQISNISYLTAHTWMYNKYYIGYVDSSNLGTLVYKRGGHHNTIDLDNDFANFHRNGTVDEIDNGIHIPGTWTFLDSAQTILQVTNYTGTYTSTIVELNYSHFNWYYTDIYGEKRYGEEIPKE